MKSCNPAALSRLMLAAAALAFAACGETRDDPPPPMELGPDTAHASGSSVDPPLALS